MRIPSNKKYILFGGTFVLANKLQVVGDNNVKGLSTKQWFLMRVLSEISPAPTITELAIEADTTRQNATKMLDILSKEGYVKLVSDKNDKRSKVVELTVKGKEILGTMQSESFDFLNEVFKNISDEELEVASSVLVKMVGNLVRIQEMENTK